MKRGLLLGLTAALSMPVSMAWINGSSKTEDLGIFMMSVDVGEVLHPGEATFDPTRREYRISASGENMWGTRDAFHFLYDQVRERGDFILEASVRFEGEGGDPHRKGGWMIRESLEPDAAYVDVMVHGDGLVSLQYRRSKGGTTEEVSAPQKAPAVIRLERTDDVFSLYVSEDGKSFQPAAGVRLDLPGPVFIGLALCSHRADRVETAVFSEVTLGKRDLRGFEERVLESTLEAIDVTTGARQLIYQAKDHLEAPNWSRDGGFLIFNSHG
ncbi:MAG TPA: hypothetical protein VMY18_01050, partial [Acidobacteriota bacterium]|nr:hypothetical protein [Acidobacteriota bacterium]